MAVDFAFAPTGNFVIRKRMQKFVWAMLVWLFSLWGVAAAETFTFRLKDGSTLSGEIGKFSFTKEGVMVKLSSGQFSRKVGWDKLTQDTLKQLATNRDALAFVESLIEEPPEEKEKEKKEVRALTIKPVENKLERPDPPAKIFAIFASPVGILLFLLIYGGSIYAAYEIAIFKNRPAALVCGAAAVLPVVGAVLFFALPPAPLKTIEEQQAEAMAQAAEAAEGQPEEVVEEPPPPPVEEAPPEPALPPTITYQRGQFIFNRRFFESKFAAYLRPVAGEAEKDMLIFIKSARGEYTGPRLTKADQNELYLKVTKGAAYEEVMIPYVEIYEVQVRHKDAV